MARAPRGAKPAPVWKPHNVVVLGIDCGAQSGWGIWTPKTLHVGTIFDRVGAEAERIRVVEAAIQVATAAGLGLVVVAEKWTAGMWGKDRRMNPATLMGLGAAWRDWQRVLQHCKVPKKRIVRVNVRTWQGRMLSGLGARTSEQLKAAAKMVVCSRFPKLRQAEYTLDAFDAGCICLWASQSAEVASALATARAWPTLGSEVAHKGLRVSDGSDSVRHDVRHNDVREGAGRGDRRGGARLLRQGSEESPPDPR